MKHLMAAMGVILLAAFTSFTGAGEAAPPPVNVSNFARAETDLYMGKAVKEGAFGQLRHRLEPAAIAGQDVVRMNHDTLCSMGVFDLAAGPITVTLPDSGRRFLSLQVLLQDQYTQAGRSEVPQWDSVSQTKARNVLLSLASLGGTGVMFGRREQVDPVSFLIGSAAGWGGNPPSAAL